MKKIILIGMMVSSLFAESRYMSKYADVTHVSEVHSTISKRVKVQECYNKEVITNPNSFGLDTLVGVAGGAIIGSQIGKGNGRVAAQVVGGLLGGKVANNMRETNRVRVIMICEDVWETQRVDVIKYKNHFTYDGREYTKISNRRLTNIRINTKISY